MMRIATKMNPLANPLARKLALTFITAVLLAGYSAHSQDRGPGQLHGLSVPEFAGFIRLNTDLIAVGEFGIPVDVGDDPLSLLRSRELDIDFTVQTVYKGAVAPGAVVKIRLRIDMLAYPGEDISRYEKRRQVLTDVRRAAEDIEVRRRTLDEAVARGEMTRAERDERLQEQSARNRQLLDEYVELRRMQRVMFTSSHYADFYEKGGAIQPGTPYLIALSPIDGNPAYYSLGEGGGGIYWGEVAEDVVTEIHRQLESGFWDQR